jgi:hypothetical protein
MESIVSRAFPICVSEKVHLGWDVYILFLFMFYVSKMLKKYGISSTQKMFPTRLVRVK